MALVLTGLRSEMVSAHGGVGKDARNPRCEQSRYFLFSQHGDSREGIVTGRQTRTWTALAWKAGYKAGRGGWPMGLERMGGGGGAELPRSASLSHHTHRIFLNPKSSPSKKTSCGHFLSAFFVLDRPLAYGVEFLRLERGSGHFRPAPSSCATSTTNASRLGSRALNGGASCPII
jgi:hypothetical protein